ncbi:MAG: GYF domain-containing protein [Victivallaceae bacterium]|nr:GYF domain-containing protein [Victivallaceae bacterium]
MQYIIKDINGEEYGPVDAETLDKWVEEDRITAETPVRSSLVKNWRKAGELPFLAERLAEQAVRREKAATMAEKSGAVLKDVKQRLTARFTPQHTSTFEHKHAPLDARLLPRLLAGSYDLALTLLIGAVMVGAALVYAYWYPASHTDDAKKQIAEKDDMMIPIAAAERARMREIEQRFEALRLGKTEKELDKLQQAFTEAVKAEKRRNAEIRAVLHENNLTADCPPYTLADKNAAYQVGSLWLDTAANRKYVCLSGEIEAARWIRVDELTQIITLCVAAWAGLMLLLNAFCLGYYAQTFGMWFWGLFITRKKIAEVYFFRAFIFTLLYPFCFLLSPLFVYIFRRGLHEMLCGVKLIRVFSDRNAP